MGRFGVEHLGQRAIRSGANGSYPRDRGRRRRAGDRRLPSETVRRGELCCEAATTATSAATGPSGTATMILATLERESSELRSGEVATGNGESTRLASSSGRERTIVVSGGGSTAGGPDEVVSTSGAAGGRSASRRWQELEIKASSSGAGAASSGGGANEVGSASSGAGEKKVTICCSGSAGGSTCVGEGLSTMTGTMSLWFLSGEGDTDLRKRGRFAGILSNNRSFL